MPTATQIPAKVHRGLAAGQKLLLLPGIVNRRGAGRNGEQGKDGIEERKGDHEGKGRRRETREGWSEDAASVARPRERRGDNVQRPSPPPGHCP